MLSVLKDNARAIEQTLTYELLNKTRKFSHNEYKNVVTKAWQYIECVPFVFRTKELCEIAVKQNGSALYFIPNHLKTQELCNVAVNKCGVLRYVPYKFRTKEICEIAVKKHATSLKDVPRKYKSYDLCKYAMAKCHYVFEYVPFRFRNKLKYEVFENSCEMCLIHHNNHIECPLIVNKNLAC